MTDDKGSEALAFDTTMILLPALLVAIVIGAKALRLRLRSSVVIDGSNVMHWNGGKPRLETVQELVRQMVKRGYQVTVIFDANAGYKLAERYMRSEELARHLGLPHHRVFVMPRGEPADPLLFEVAKSQRARILSNDRFRDWQVLHPESTKDSKIIRGGYNDGRLWVQD